MNAENYVKAFQGIMGVYGLQFLLVPKKIVRCFFDDTFKTLCRRLFSVIVFIPNPIDSSPPVTSKGKQKETKLTSRISLSLSLNSHFDADIRIHTNT